MTETKKSHAERLGPMVPGPFIPPEEARKHFPERTNRLIRWANDDHSCSLWLGSTDKKGYPRNAVARRSWQRCVGPIPAGKVLDHLLHCSRACVAPHHLRLCTQGENMANSLPALKTECLRGHVFDAANTYWRPGGGRTCRSCNKQAVARLRMRKREQTHGTRPSWPLPMAA